MHAHVLILYILLHFLLDKYVKYITSPKYVFILIYLCERKCSIQVQKELGVYFSNGYAHKIMHCCSKKKQISYFKRISSFVFVEPRLICFSKYNLYHENKREEN